MTVLRSLFCPICERQEPIPWDVDEFAYALEEHWFVVDENLGADEPHVQTSVICGPDCLKKWASVRVSAVR